MGILKGPLTGSTGSAWDMTLGSWKGLKIFKGKRKKGLTNPSDSVLQHQSAIRQLVAIGQSLTVVFRRSFKQYDSTSGTWGAYIKENINANFDYASPPAADINMNGLFLAKGVMAPTHMTTQVADDSANTVVVTYPTTLNAGQDATDKLQMIIWNETQNYWRTYNNVAARSAGTATISDTTMLTADNIIIYTWFESQIDLTNETNTSYEITVVA